MHDSFNLTSHYVYRSVLRKSEREQSIVTIHFRDPARLFFHHTMQLIRFCSEQHYNSVLFKGTMGRDPVRSHHADPPGWVERPSEEPEKRIHASNDETNETRIIKEYETELQNRREAIMALRDVVMRQREAIRSLKADRRNTEATYPLQEIRPEAVSGTSTLSGSDSSSTDICDESASTEEPGGTNSPPVSFDPSNQSEVTVQLQEEMSAITCEEHESSIDSSNFLKMQYEMQAVMEAAKAQASSPVDQMISFEKPKSFEEEMPPPPKAANGGIEEVIESIQEQASHVDAAIVLDKLQTTRNELQSVTSDLRNRNAEVVELKNQVKLLEGKIATLELERDLHVSNSGY